jgi:hypothetical protein
MQIHELTRPRKITEQGFLGGLAAGIQPALSKLGIQGPAAIPQNQFTGPSVNRAQALAAGQKTAQLLMPVMQKNWAKAVQAAMTQSTDPATNAPPTSAGRLTSGEQSRLKAELVSMVNNAIQSQGSFDYTRLPNNIGDDTTPEGQTTKAQAMKTVQYINQAIETIFKATLDPKADPSTAWQQLVKDGIAPAQGILAFDKGGIRSGTRAGQVEIKTDTAGNPQINFGQGWIKFDKNNPEHKAAAEKQAAGLNK